MFNDNSPPYTPILTFVIAVKQQLSEVCEPYGLSSMQAITLLLLDGHKPQPMKNLCVTFHCDAGNITGIIDGLESRQFVSRQRNPADRRIKSILLTPAGYELQQQIIADLNALQHTLMTGLTPKEAEQFIRLLAKATPTSRQ